MRRFLLTIAFTILIVSQSFAGLTVKLTNIDPTTSGGPFAADVKQDGTLIAEFDTFCVEKNEFFNPSITYDVTIDDEIKFGGIVPTTLEDQTKKLYAAFLNGAFTSSDWSPLQNAFWQLESQNPGSGDTGGFDTADLSGYNTSGWENVKVMNLWHPTTGAAAQSQLILIPAPGAILLGSIGIGLIGYLRRRRSI